MSPTKTRLTQLAVALGLLALGFAGGYAWMTRTSDTTPPIGKSGADQARKVLYWYDPMAPEQRFDKPGKSPFMDMELLPKYADEAMGGGTQIDPRLQQNVGIRTQEVTVESLGTAMRVPGTLTWDLTQETVVSARMEGLITHVQVKAPFTEVRRGQALATVQAPAWNAAIAEAHALSQAQSAGARELQGAAQQRLRSLGVPSGASARSGVVLGADHSGVVTEILAREGQTVMPGTPLFKINGLDTLWLEASVPQAALGTLRPGTSVQATVSAWPAERFAGQIQALLPQVDMASRTQRARIVLRNPQRRLVPGMFAEVLVQPDAEQALPVVPTEALIATGRDSRVIVQDPDGSFRPVRVSAGRSVQGRTQIVAGLAGGERVVVSGQFLLDSEASLSGALERLGAAQPTRPASASGVHERHDAGHEPRTVVPSPSRQPAPVAPDTSTSTPPRCPVQYWYDPMVPEKHFDKPGKSPFMDMQLVPKFGPAAAADCQASEVMSEAMEGTP